MTPMESVLKLAASIAVMMTVALLVASRADFIFGSVGLCIAIGALAVNGLEEERVNLIEVANKNSYSLYALPAVLLALYIAMRTDWKKVPFRKIAVLVALIATAVSAVAIFAGGNRSGWLGLGLIVVMLGLYLVLSRRLRFSSRSRGVLLLIGMVGIVVAGLFYKGVEEFTYRYQQTVQGYSSDTERWQLFVNAVEIGLENPIRGVCPTYLPVVLEQRFQPGYSKRSRRRPAQCLRTHHRWRRPPHLRRIGLHRLDALHVAAERLEADGHRIRIPRRTSAAAHDDRALDRPRNVQHGNPL